MKQHITLRASLVLIALHLCSLLGGTSALRAQTEPDPLASHIGVIARATGDSIIIRWGPSNIPLWLGGNESGYIIERSVAGEKSFTRLGATVKPWPREKWVDFLTPRLDLVLPDSAIDYPQVAYSLLYDSTTADLGLSTGDEKEIRERFSSLDMARGFMLIAADRSAEAAEGLGLRFVDHDVKRGVAYTYRVRLASSLRTYHADTGSVTITNVPYDASRSRRALTRLEGDHLVALNWPAAGGYGSYIVSRSEDGGRSFTKLTRVPLITIRQTAVTDRDSESFLDTTAINYHSYLYRVEGTTPFADLETVGEATAMPRDLTPPGMPMMHNPTVGPGHAVHVTWEMAEPVAPDLAGFRVLRGEEDSGAFSPIAKALAPDARAYIDTLYSDTLHNYYVIEAYDTAGNARRSFAAYAPLPDTTPPAMPVIVSGLMDSTGIVTLKLKGNTERDLMGYRILRANSPEHEFSAIHESYANPDAPEARSTTFFDTVTLRSLTPYVYYRVIALDRSYNESPLSAIYAVARPDIIPPVPPVINDVSVTDSNVTIDFTPSSSKDVRTQILLRRLEGEKDWQPITTLTPTDRRTSDADVKQNTVYEYAMMAIDSSGNKSKHSGSVVARPYRVSIIEGIRDLAARSIDSGRAVQLNWTPSKVKGASNMIYRGIAGKPVEQYANVTTTAGGVFLDREVTKGTSYTYAIKVHDTEGRESRLSPRTTVTP